MSAPSWPVPESGLWRFESPVAVSPRQMLLGFLGFVLVTQVIGLAFYAAGAEPIWAFAWLELLVLGVVLWRYARHLSDAETITLAQSELTVEVREGNVLEREAFQRSWAQVSLTDGRSPLVRIHQGRQCILVGRFVPPAQRAGLARALRHWIDGGNRV